MQKPKFWEILLTTTAAIVSITSFLEPIIDIISPGILFKIRLASLSLLILLIIYLCISYRNIIKYIYDFLYKCFSHLAPLATLATLMLVGLIYLALESREQVIPIDFTQGAIYNSWEDKSHRNASENYIVAWGHEKGDPYWVIDSAGRASFSYETNDQETIDPNASSGGYVIFYDQPIDRLTAHEISFDVRATDTTCQPDLGVRLAVGDRNSGVERVTYEIPSLLNFFGGKHMIKPFWQSFRIELLDFKVKKYDPAMPDNLNRNTINKVVFFVNSDAANKCSSATLSFRNLAFIIR